MFVLKYIHIALYANELARLGQRTFILHCMLTDLHMCAYVLSNCTVCSGASTGVLRQFHFVLYANRLACLCLRSLYYTIC